MIVIERASVNGSGVKEQAIPRTPFVSPSFLPNGVLIPSTPKRYAHMTLLADSTLSVSSKVSYGKHLMKVGCVDGAKVSHLMMVFVLALTVLKWLVSCPR